MPCDASLLVSTDGFSPPHRRRPRDPRTLYLYEVDINYVSIICNSHILRWGSRDQRTRAGTGLLIINTIGPNGGSRTHTPFGTGTWSQRVCQFRHIGLFFIKLLHSPIIWSAFSRTCYYSILSTFYIRIISHLTIRCPYKFLTANKTCGFNIMIFRLMVFIKMTTSIGDL